MHLQNNFVIIQYLTKFLIDFHRKNDDRRPTLLLRVAIL